MLVFGLDYRMDLLGAFTQNVATPVTLAIAIILIASLLRRGRARREDFVTALGFAIFGTFAKELQTLLIRAFPVTLDPALLHIDHGLGFNPIHFAKWAVKTVRRGSKHHAYHRERCNSAASV